MFLALEVFFLSSLFTYIGLKWHKYLALPKDFPPGPPLVPVLGALPFIGENFRVAIERWREEYGDVVGVQLGTDLAVVLSDFTTIEKVFKDPNFAGRPSALQTVMSAFFASKPGEENGGIVFTHGQEWSEQRRFSLKTLRDFGFGKKSMEDVIMVEVDKLCDVISGDSNGNKSLGAGDKVRTSESLCHDLSVSVVNSLWTILAGSKIEHGDKMVEVINSGTATFIRNESLSGAIMMLPWLRHLPFIRDKFTESKKAPLSMRLMQDKAVADHQGGTWENAETNLDFIDVYLKKIAETNDKNSSFYGDKGKLNLQRSLTDMFGAGSETTSSSLLFAFLYMIKHPDIQAKIQAEIDQVCAENSVTLDDRPSMPYTDAVLHEVMRYACLVYAVPHAATMNVDLEGFNIPRGTAVYANVWNVMHGEDYWKNPELFDPTRFLDETGTKLRRREHYIPFMLGRRFCIGQTLAEKQLFLFFVSLLQKFQFQAPEGPDKVSVDPIVGFIHRCPEYSVDISLRKETSQPFWAF